MTLEQRWWRLLDYAWNDILECFDRVSDAPDKMYPLTASKENLLGAYRERNARELYGLLSNMFHAAPDHRRIHSWPSWDVVCDLLANFRGVFDEEDE